MAQELGPVLDQGQGLAQALGVLAQVQVQVQVLVVAVVQGRKQDLLLARMLDQELDQVQVATVEAVGVAEAEAEEEDQVVGLGRDMVKGLAGEVDMEGEMKSNQVHACYVFAVLVIFTLKKFLKLQRKRISNVRIMCVYLVVNLSYKVLNNIIW